MLSELEDEIKLEVNNKSMLISKIMDIEIHFFARMKSNFIEIPLFNREKLQKKQYEGP